MLDGTLVDRDRVAGVTGNDNDLWYSGKGHRFAGNIRFVAAPDGALSWISVVGADQPRQPGTGSVERAVLARSRW